MLWWFTFLTLRRTGSRPGKSFLCTFIGIPGYGVLQLTKSMPGIVRLRTQYLSSFLRRPFDNRFSLVHNSSSEISFLCALGVCCLALSIISVRKFLLYLHVEFVWSSFRDDTFSMLRASLPCTANCTGNLVLGEFLSVHPALGTTLSFLVLFPKL